MKAEKYIRKGVATLHDEGLLTTTIQTLQKIERDRNRKSKLGSKKKALVSLVKREDVLSADWSSHPYHPPELAKRGKRPVVVNWVMSPPSGGGGHQNIFRFIEHLDRKGYQNNVYIYSTVDNMPITQARQNVQAYCNAEHLTFKRYNGLMVDADFVFATGWETAYPVFNDKIVAKKMYFVQDFEPLFYPMGTDYVLAENTYKFGFHGITAGGWLSEKLSREYGMKCDSYNFAADKELYGYTNAEVRKEVFFYARPVTERRGFDLGIMALQIFHQQNPDYIINLAGWDVSDYEIPFPYVNHKALQLGDLSGLYNRCAAALVLSLTNMSLLPLELLACGTIPVLNDGENNRLVSDNPYLAYTEAAPASLAHKLNEVVRRKRLPKYAKEAATSLDQSGWLRSLEKFEAVLQRELP